MKHFTSTFFFLTFLTFSTQVYHTTQEPSIQNISSLEKEEKWINSFKDFLKNKVEIYKNTTSNHKKKELKKEIRNIVKELGDHFFKSGTSKVTRIEKLYQRCKHFNTMGLWDSVKGYLISENILEKKTNQRSSIIANTIIHSDRSAFTFFIYHMCKKDSGKSYRHLSWQNSVKSYEYASFWKWIQDIIHSMPEHLDFNNKNHYRACFQHVNQKILELDNNTLVEHKKSLSKIVRIFIKLNSVILCKSAYYNNEETWCYINLNTRMMVFFQAKATQTGENNNITRPQGRIWSFWTLSRKGTKNQAKLNKKQKQDELSDIFLTHTINTYR